MSGEIRFPAEIEKLIGNMMAEISYNRAPAKFKFPGGLRYRYFGRFWLAAGVWAFCHSTTRNANGKFVSWVYQPIVGKKSWKVTKMLEHRRAKDSKARALRMYNQHLPVQERYEAEYRQRQKKNGGKQFDNGGSR